MKKSEKEKIIKSGKFKDVNLDDGIYQPVKIRKGRGKKGRTILDFEENGERFSVQLDWKYRQTIQMAHRRFRLKKLLKLKDRLGLEEKG